MGLDSFPENIAGFKLVSVTDNENTHPGRGYSGQYQAAGIKFSLYEYSNGLSSIPDGIDSIASRDQFRQSVDYVLSINPVANVATSGASSQRFIIGQTPLLHTVFTYPDTETVNRENVWSHLYLTAHSNNFIKIRCTYSAKNRPAPDYRIQKQFLEQYCAMMQPHTDMAAAHTIEAPQMSDDTFPRDLLPLHFRSLAGGIPVNGGWGYSSADAVIIGENDSRELGWQPFDSEGLKLVFIEKRIQEELVCSRSEDDKCTDIRWNMLAQSSVDLDGKKYDVMTFEVSAITEKDSSALNAAHLPGRDAACRQEQSAVRFRYVSEYWFHVKKSMSVLLQSLFNEFTAWHRDMALNKGVVPTTLSGVAANGRQFIVQLTGSSFSDEELRPFMQTVLAAEHAVAYATGSLKGHFGEEGEMNEEVYVVTASAHDCLQGSAPLQRDADGVITAVGDFSRYDDCTPHDCVQASLLTGGDVGTAAAERERYMSVWGEIRKTVHFRQR